MQYLLVVLARILPQKPYQTQKGTTLEGLGRGDCKRVLACSDSLRQPSEKVAIAEKCLGLQVADPKGFRV